MACARLSKREPVSFDRRSVQGQGYFAALEMMRVADFDSHFRLNHLNAGIVSL